MSDLHEQLRRCFQKRVCLMGLGNVDCGDDGFGVRLAEKLRYHGTSGVIAAGTSPEQYLGRVATEGFDHVIFLDAVHFGGIPGSVVFLNAREIAARFPQISTHHISLGLLAKLVEANGRVRAWLLGVQAESLRGVGTLTPKVEKTLETLGELLGDLRSPAHGCLADANVC
jgi:hydrogenase maturation protease